MPTLWRSLNRLTAIISLPLSISLRDIVFACIPNVSIYYTSRVLIGFVNPAKFCRVMFRAFTIQYIVIKYFI